MSAKRVARAVGPINTEVLAVTKRSRRELETIEKKYKAVAAIAELDGKGPGAAARERIESNNQETASANRLAEAWKDVIAKRFDPKLKGAAATKADKDVIDQFAPRPETKRPPRQASTMWDRFPELVRQREAKLADQKRRMDEERLAQRNKEYAGANDPIENARIDARDANLRGAEATAADRDKADKRVSPTRCRGCNPEGPRCCRLPGRCRQRQGGRWVAKTIYTRRMLASAPIRIRRAATPPRNAEEGLEKQLLSIRQKLGQRRQDQHRAAPSRRGRGVRQV